MASSLSVLLFFLCVVKSLSQTSEPVTSELSEPVSLNQTSESVSLTESVTLGNQTGNMTMDMTMKLRNFSIIWNTDEVKNIGFTFFDLQRMWNLWKKDRMFFKKIDMIFNKINRSEMLNSDDILFVFNNLHQLFNSTMFDRLQNTWSDLGTKMSEEGTNSKAIDLMVNDTIYSNEIIFADEMSGDQGT